MKNLLLIFFLALAVTVSAQPTPIYYLVVPKNYKGVVRSGLLEDSNGRAYATNPGGRFDSMTVTQNFNSRVWLYMGGTGAVVATGPGANVQGRATSLYSSGDGGASFFASFINATASGTNLGAILNGGTATLSGAGSSIEGAIYARNGYRGEVTTSAFGSKFKGFCYGSNVQVSGMGATVDAYAVSNPGDGFQTALIAAGLGSLIKVVAFGGRAKVGTNGGVIMGGVEADGQMLNWSAAGMMFGLCNKGYFICGDSTKMAAGAPVHASFLNAANYWYDSRAISAGEASFLHGLAYMDSCAAMDTMSVTFGKNVKNYGKYSFAFGSEYRTTEPYTFNIGWNGNDFSINGVTKVLTTTLAFQTSAPSGSGAGVFKIGKVRTGSDAQKYWEIDVDGTLYYVHALTSLP